MPGAHILYRLLESDDDRIVRAVSQLNTAIPSIQEPIMRAVFYQVGRIGSGFTRTCQVNGPSPLAFSAIVVSYVIGLLGSLWPKMAGVASKKKRQVIKEPVNSLIKVVAFMVFRIGLRYRTVYRDIHLPLSLHCYQIQHQTYN